MADERPFSPEDHAACLRVLAALAAEPGVLLDKERDDFGELAAVRGAANRLIEAVKGEVRVRRGQPRSGRPASATTAPPGPAPRPRGERGFRCYACRTLTPRGHAAYPLFCPACGERNLDKRNQTADLTGWRAVVTGGRIRIGNRVALKLLRSGARVEITTRFPRTAAKRFADEPDHVEWRDRLRIHGLDFRDLAAVCLLADRLAAEGPLEVLVNNAAQTIRRPDAELVEQLRLEASEQSILPIAIQSLVTSTILPNPRLPLALGGTNESFPLRPRDAEGELVDQRRENSWTQRIGEVPRTELLEAHAVNALAPYLLLDGLLPALRASPRPRRFVVNVAAAEGRFTGEKPVTHPHTNMAKAALNMLTRTVAADLAPEGIYVNSVDPGWVSNQYPLGRPQPPVDPPLDPEDGAARILDPVLLGATGEEEPVFGRLLKDFVSVDW